MKTLRILTIAVMVGAILGVLGLLVYDLIPATIEPSATISVVTLAWWQRYPIVPLLVGLAAGIPLGHIAWPQRTE